jgi:hypothetical protein
MAVRKRCDKGECRLFDLEAKNRSLLATLQEIVKDMEANGMQSWTVANKARAAIAKATGAA